jgi:uncharacterized membrane protein YedE/YeeE
LPAPQYRLEVVVGFPAACGRPPGKNLEFAMAFFAACVFAFILGFAAHRASICTVRAIAEMFTARTAHMLGSILKSALWVLAIALPIFLLMPSVSASVGGWQLTGSAMLGGFLFGVGAASNGACAYTTMARLVDGDVGMLITIAGFAVGIVAFVTLVDMHVLSRPAPRPAMINSLNTWFLIPIGALLLWACYEMTKFWRRRPPDTTLRSLIFARQYRLSSAALLIGLSSSAIFFLIGSPGYSATLQNVVEGIIGSRAWPTFQRGALVLAVLMGMAFSTLQRGSFRIDWRPKPSWIRNIIGGVMMGLGTALLPGGNDALILYGIPSLSPHAIPSYMALALGIAAGLLLMRYMLGVHTRAVCRNDLYIAEESTKP